MAFQITGLDPVRFAPLFLLSTSQLAKRGIVEDEAKDKEYPCRVSLRHATLGDRLLLLNYTHQPAHTPYRSSHAIFVSQGATRRGRFTDEIPPIMSTRTLSIRAFDSSDMMVDADVAEGRESKGLIERMLGNSRAAYLHVHFAKRGCFAARIDPI